MEEENHDSNTEEAVQEPIDPDEEISDLHEDNSDDVPLKYFVHLVRVNKKLYEMEETSSTTKKCPHQG